MYIRRVIINNVGPHKQLDVSLENGSVGIFGPNGSGKSTFIDCIYACLTNDFTRFDGIKTDCINNQTEENAESLIAVDAEHNGMQFRVERWLRPSRHRLFVGEEKFTNNEKIQEKLDDMLGVDRRMLDLFAFKRQNAIYDFLSTTPAERAKAYAILCRTEVCEQLWSMLGEYLNQDTELRAEIVDNSDELASSLAEFKGKLAEFDAAIEIEKPKLLNTKSWETAQEILKRFGRYDLYRLEHGELTAGLKLMVRDVEWAKQVAADHKAKLAKSQQELAECADAVTEAQSVLAQFARYDTMRKHVQQVKKDTADLVEEAAKRVKPEPPEEVPQGRAAIGNDVLPLWSKQQTQWELELEAAQRVVATFSENGVVVCPTCGTAATELIDYLEEQRGITVDLPPKIANKKKLIQLLTTYRTQLTAYEKWQEGYAARKQANVAAAAAIKELKLPEGDRGEWQKVIRAAEERQAVIPGLETACRKAERSEAAQIADLETQKKRIVVLETKIAENKESDERVDKAKRRLAEHEVSRTIVARLEGERAGYARLIAEKKDDLERLRVRLKRGRKLRQMAAVLERAREKMHRDVLPRMVAQTNLSRMEGAINKGLEFFGSPFWAETDENLDFNVHKPGEPPQRAGRLSTGQKVILALAFWPAVAALWGHDLGMLALDEPTANLDEENRSYLASMLEQLTAQVRGKRQILLVTHADNLRSVFDTIVDLAP